MCGRFLLRPRPALSARLRRLSVTAAHPPAVPEPSVLQLRRHALACAVPMVGFGFMDNLVMIQAGDAIDSTIGVAFGLSTLTAAAYGQVISDVSGTVFGSAVDTAAAWLGLPAAGLTRAQCELRNVRVLSTTAASVGVVLGCLLGMTSLLFMDLDKNEVCTRCTRCTRCSCTRCSRCTPRASLLPCTQRLKKQRELRTLFATLMEAPHAMPPCYAPCHAPCCAPCYAPCYAPCHAGLATPRTPSQPLQPLTAPRDPSAPCDPMQPPCGPCQPLAAPVRPLGTQDDPCTQDGHRLIGAERCGLFLVDADGEHLFRQAAALQWRRQPCSSGGSPAQ